jgi:hypothetical protein
LIERSLPDLHSGRGRIVGGFTQWLRKLVTSWATLAIEAMQSASASTSSISSISSISFTYLSFPHLFHLGHYPGGTRSSPLGRTSARQVPLAGRPRGPTPIRPEIIEVARRESPTHPAKPNLGQYSPLGRTVARQVPLVGVASREGPQEFMAGGARVPRIRRTMSAARAGFRFSGRSIGNLGKVSR